MDVRIDDRELRRLLADAPRLIPFTVSKALNNVAFATRNEIRKHIKDDGINLRRAWVVYGIRVLHKATRTDLAADVGSIDPIMAAASEGGDRPFPGLIPMVGPGMPRPSKDAVIAAKFRRSANLLEKVMDQKNDAEFGKRRFIIGDGIYERYKAKPRERYRSGGPAGKVTYALYPIRRLFTIPTGKVRIPSRWRYAARVATSLGIHWEQAVIQAVDYALRNQRPGR